jgi:hypothetical protein
VALNSQYSGGNRSAPRDKSVTLICADGSAKQGTDRRGLYVV